MVLAMLWETRERYATPAPPQDRTADRYQSIMDACQSIMDGHCRMLDFSFTFHRADIAETCDRAIQLISAVQLCVCYRAPEALIDAFLLRR
jgi:hypothetical protein